MSAATEELLEQITQLETLLLESKRAGRDASRFEEKLVELRARLSFMNENLSKNDRVLKG